MRPPNRSGFTVLELVVVVSILALLAAIVLPNVVTASKEARASKILAGYDAVAKACQGYFEDTAQTAQEFGDPARTAAGDHRLSLAQAGIPGWDGPYLDHPLTSGDNPYGSLVACYPDLTGDAAGVLPNGFDLTGSGSANATGAGNFVGFLGVPQDVARLVDDALDRNVPGGWDSTGRVEWVASGGALAIFVLDTDGR